jgi:hypothetical protein
MSQITTLVGPYFYVLIPKSIPSGVYVLIFHLAEAPQILVTALDFSSGCI